MIIEKATLNEEIKINNFYKEVIETNNNNHTNFARWNYEKYPSPTTIRQAILEGEQYICKYRDIIVGAFVLNKDPQGNYQKYGKWTILIREGEYYIIHAFAVSPEKTQNGVGKFMINFIKQKAKFDHIPSVRTDVFYDNRPAITLLESMCFRCVGEGDLDRYDIIGVNTFKLYEYNI